MTGKEYMANKIKEKINEIFKKYNLAAEAFLNLTKEGPQITVSCQFKIENAYKKFAIPFDIIKGFSLEHIGNKYVAYDFKNHVFEDRWYDEDYKEEVFSRVSDIWREINKETVLYRFLISKGITSAQIRKMYNLDKDALKPAPKAAPTIIATPENDDSYPNEIKNARMYRIKIGTGRTRRVCFGDKITDQGMTIKAPYDIGVKRSGEISFISQADAEEFIKARDDFFSQWNNIQVYKSNVNSFHRIKTPGTTKAYATEDFIKYLSKELGKIPPLYT